MVGSSSKFKSSPSPENVPFRDLISSSISSREATDARDCRVAVFPSAASVSSSKNSISTDSSSASYIAGNISFADTYTVFQPYSTYYSGI